MREHAVDTYAESPHPAAMRRHRGEQPNNHNHDDNDKQCHDLCVGVLMLRTNNAAVA